MESQVKVLELEASLQQERQKLASLRRRHYQLAGEGEGWEKGVCYYLFILLLFSPGISGINHHAIKIFNFFFYRI